jgi:hypothetical protein
VAFARITNLGTGLAETQAQYTLVYSKDDVVNSIIGTNALI